MKRFGILFWMLLDCMSACHAATTWYVSKSGADSNNGKSQSAALLTIQKAIDKSSAGDSILVSNGTYNYITIPATKEPLTIRSTGGAANCTIKGASGQRCVTVGTGATTNVFVVGFTLTGGSLSGQGNNGAGAMGGTYNNCIIKGNNSGSITTAAGAYKCTLNDCTITNNVCTDWSGGLESCIANRCKILGNKSTHVGAGGAAGCILTDCVISGNSGSGEAGGVSNCTMYRCKLSNNTCSSTTPGREINGGVAYDCILDTKISYAIAAAKCYNCTIVSSSGSPSIWRDTKLYNCIVSSTGKAFSINGDSNWSVDLNNCVLNNVSLGTYTSQTSCSTANPKFVSNSDYRLQAGSPCIDKGNNSYVQTAVDYAGNARIQNGKVDVGAYEYSAPCTISAVSAVQRFPWNGLVDLKFKISGSSNTRYAISLSAKDVAGGTNIAMSVVRKSNGVAANVADERLLPGNYTWVWDAATDLPKGWKRDRVVIKVTESAATGTSAEFKIDLCGMGPWETRTAAASEAIAYSSAWATNTMSGAKAVVKVYPVKREKPKYIAIDLSGGTAATHYPTEYLNEIPGGSWSDEYKTSKLVLRHIPAGSFIMGGRYTDYPGATNTNLHMVTLTKDFYMGVFEVTQRQWELVMGNRPSAFSNQTYYAARPVEQVRFIDVRGGVKGIMWPQSKEVDDGSFMGVLRAKSGMTGFDLPTEAQWEYACRAGTTTGLNSGKNCLQTSGAELNEVARCASNSGWMENGNTWSASEDLTDTSRATAKVGSYLPNGWGLYDMHGNVWELCLDITSTTNVSLQSIDPIGFNYGSSNRRAYRGGSWRHYADGCVSGHQDHPRWTWNQSTSKAYNVGLRLCLQGGEIPESTAGTVLVNAAGTGDATWTPTRAGTYYLTHETQTNGVNGAEVLSAWFKVEGPQLTFAPDGELTPGVKVAIGGAGDGWTVHYTTDGAAPTSGSPEYTAPITLDGSATIRAVAYSDGGMESQSFSATFTLHDALSVVGAVAKPRYPWNGMVDVDCEVKGEPGRDYAITLEARDLDGGTNLPVRTARQAGCATVGNAFLVKPGQYRFTWNADADIAGDGDFANVAVSVNAESSTTVGAKRVVTLAVDGYTGTEVLTNVPTLVRLSTTIDGFSYADFADANGRDLIFCDESESVIYPHEIDEWHIDGESLVWVKLPELRQGTKFKMAYGNSQSSFAMATEDRLSSHEVWSDYAGVWHMNEDSGTAYDSTAHGLDAQPETGTNKTVNILSEMAAYDSGAVGRARQNEISDVNETKGCGNYLLTPSCDALQIGGSLVASGWFRAEKVVNFPRMISRKKSSGTSDGWEIHPRQHSTTNISVRGATSGSMVCDVPNMDKTWVSIVAVYEPGHFSCYTNGVLCGMSDSETIAIAPVDNGLGLAFGCNPPGDENTWCGQYDEIRLRGGSLSADRIKADYDMIKNRNFLRYSAAERGNGIEPTGGSGQEEDSPEIVVPLSAPQNVLENSRWIECTDFVWDPVPGAVAYEIFNSGNDSSSPASAVKVYETTEPNFHDDDHSYGAANDNLWIRARDKDGRVSEFSGPFRVGKYIS